jgi:hypothetical protein
MSWMTVVALVALADLPPPTNSSQGSRLHGTGALEHVNIPLGNVVMPPSPSGNRSCPRSARFEKGELQVVPRCASTRPGPSMTAPITGKALEGTKFYAPHEGALVPLVITNVRAYSRPRRDGHPRWEYQVMREEVSDGCKGLKGGRNKCTPICRTASSGYALAVPHAWSMSGELLRNPDYFTFACMPAPVSVDPPQLEGGGVIAKCIDWGLPPWPVNETQDEQEALQLHQACVRMATADYCGEGRANTIEGTPLSFYNLRGLPSGALPETLPSMLEDNSQGEVFLEAVWAVDDCGNKVQPLCLGRKRWASLALDGACLDRDKVEGQAQRRLGGAAGSLSPCEGVKLEDLKKNKALLVSYSRNIDKLLVRFGNPGTGAYWTTSAITLESGGVNPISPKYKPDLRDIGSYSSIRVEGPILSHLLSQQFITSNEWKRKLKPIYRCKNPEGAFVLTNSPDCQAEPGSGKTLFPGYTLDKAQPDGGLEGYVFASLMSPGGDELKPENRLLRVWKHQGSQRFAVSTERPDGYEEREVLALGYLPTLGMLPSRMVGHLLGAGMALKFPL